MKLFNILAIKICMNKFHLTLKFYFFILLYLSSFNVIFGQSATLTKDVDNILKISDSLIIVQEYDVALSRLERFESNRDAILNNENKLLIGLKKAQLYYSLNEEEKAMSLLLKNLDELKLLDLPELKISYSNYLGEIFRNSKDYSRSIDYYKMSFSFAKEMSDSLKILKSYINIGRTFQGADDMDSAKFYYTKVIIVDNKDLNRGEIVSTAYNNLSIIANDNNDLELAENYINKSIEKIYKALSVPSPISIPIRHFQKGMLSVLLT